MESSYYYFHFSYLHSPDCLINYLFYSIIMAIWHYIDIALDVNQSVTYYDMVFDMNSEYRTWRLQYQKDTNSIYPEVSPWYFYVAAMIWIGPSFLFTLFLCVFKFDDFLGFIYCSSKQQIKDFGDTARFVITILLLPIGTVISILFMYLIVPALFFHSAVREAIKGDSLNEEDGCKFFKINVNSKFLSFMKFLEILGEALPQFILCIVLIINQYPFLEETDTIFGIPVPVSIISACFSSVSILNGLKTGCCLIRSSNQQGSGIV